MSHKMLTAIAVIGGANAIRGDYRDTRTPGRASRIATLTRIQMEVLSA